MLKPVVDGICTDMINFAKNRQKLGSQRKTLSLLDAKTYSFRSLETKSSPDCISTNET